ncbi:hypothetical protein Hdeb2414_s0013g00416421 [Helianthus debilis subsp. tardiflorus]
MSFCNSLCLFLPALCYISRHCVIFCDQLCLFSSAWIHIVEYGYYKPKIEESKKTFFEYVQGEAEPGLERLHLCAEKELQTYIINENKDIRFIGCLLNRSELS